MNAPERDWVVLLLAGAVAAAITLWGAIAIALAMR